MRSKLPPGPVSFDAHVELLRMFLARREQIVECIENVLNAQRKPLEYLQDQSLLSRHLEDCFFARAAMAANENRLRSELEEAYCADGFEPRSVQGLYNDLIHPAEMMSRAFYCWQQTRWPGRNGREHYAHTLFNLFAIRRLQFLSLRLWDDDPARAGVRLAAIQSVLDEAKRRKRMTDADTRALSPLV